MTVDKVTLGVYDAKASEYADMVSDADDQQLIEFISALPKGATVLDLGCGPGNAARKMAEAGLSVEAMDASAEMVKLAQAQPGVSARLASFDDIEGVDIYDGIWANFSLLHADRADMPVYLAALRAALKPGGVLHIGMKTGTGAHRDGIGRLYTFFTERELGDLLRVAGFEPIVTNSGVDKGLAGSMDPWVTMSSHG